MIFESMDLDVLNGSYSISTGKPLSAHMLSKRGNKLIYVLAEVYLHICFLAIITSIYGK